MKIYMSNVCILTTVLFTLLFAVDIARARGKLNGCKCSKKDFACSHESKCSCIPLAWKCDSEFDCSDFSDERDCDLPICPDDWFRCDNGLCIKGDWRCDGDNDCLDDSDESECPVKECDPTTEKTCDSGTCIPERWWCDEQEDCEGGEDEKNCKQKNCTLHDFVCKNKDCILSVLRCDDEFDCRDGSDEEDCDGITAPPFHDVIHGNLTCKNDDFFCGRDTGEARYADDLCINRDYVCDGDRDCASGSDEENCVFPCTREQFPCDDGECVSLHKHCDGVDDCKDGSDETECELVDCITGEFRCTDNVCISQSWRCDGYSDCKDGSDEKGCAEPSRACDPNHFECHSKSQCIQPEWRCDSENDCEDGSDELYCECQPREYLCLSGDCIALGRLCDGVPDCQDSSDEPPINSCNTTFVLGLNTSSCSVANGGCEYKCKVTPSGRKQCVCPRGFHLATDLRTCIDLDECQVEGSCSQQCNNTVGSYVCSCLSGYELRPDGRTCRASGPAASLLFTNRIDIRRMSPDRPVLTPIHRGLENAIGLDYHIERKLMFWTDVTLDKITRSSINGSDVKEVISSGLESPGGVAVDWIHDLLYWTDSSTSRIEVSELDGRHRKVLLWQDLQKPRALALHPLKGLMFWTDWGKTPFVGSAAMDGSMKRALASHNVFWPNGLAIDYTNNQIYWSDAKYHIIEAANLDGENRRPIISSGLPHPFGITIFEDKVYWTDWQTKSVNSANKFTGNGVRTIRKQLHFPMDIRTYHPLRQPKGKSKCENATCSRLCLPNPQGFTCACPTGFRTVNETQCAENIETFLVFTRKDDIRQISFDATVRADTVLQLEGLKNVVALDWYSGPPGYIYWSDIGLDTISRCDWDGSNQKTVISSSLDSPAGIAVDWVNDKIYWTDSGINRIEAAMLDGSMRCILVWTGLDLPRAIVVNPKSGHMFWTDWGKQPKIERAGMDGSNRVTIVSTALKWPNGIAIDYVTEKIYWTDAGMGVIESSDMNGRKRHVIVRNLQHPFGITLDDTMVYWTDWNNKSIQYADKNTGKNHTILRRGLQHLMDIRYCHKSRIHIPNPCSVKNGGCSHLCLLSPAPNNRNPDPVFSCACPTGFVLGQDGKTCNTNMNKFLVIARRLDIRVISLDVNYSADVRLDINTYMTNVVDVAMDPIGGHLYWSDIRSNKISRTLLSDSPGNVSVVIDSGLDTVDGLTVDVNGRLLYWTDDGKNTISVATLDGKVRRVLISDNLDSPRAIALHYESGYMYWTDWGSKPTAKIERAGMDGSGRSVIITSGLNWPNGLTIDHQEGWLIWGDAQTEKIERSDLLGGNRVTLLSPAHHPYSLTTLDGYLYWTDWQTKNVERLNLHNLTDVLVMRENMPSMMGIDAVTMNVSLSNVCGENNGGCSHLCLRSPNSNLGYTCACPTGVQIQNDGKTCSDLPNEYLLFTKRKSIQRVSLEADEVAVELPLKNLENAIALDYHYDQQLLFFTDVYLDEIRQSRLDGSEVRTIVSDNLKTMDGLAVDWVADNFYWTDTGLNTISVARLNGSSRKTIVDTNLDEPRALCVHPTAGLLFWTDWGYKAKIEKSYLDGTNRKVLVHKNLQWPNGITIDYRKSRVYWVDAHHDLNRIESCDLSGRKRKVVISPVPHGFSLAFLDSTLYWTDWQTKCIHSATLPLGKNKRKILLKKVDDLMALKAVSAARQTGSNLCDSSRGYGGCRYLCLMRGPTKFVCATPDESANASSQNYVDHVTSPTNSRKPDDAVQMTSLFETTVAATTLPSTDAKVTLSQSASTAALVNLVAVCVGTAIVVFAVSAFVGFLLWRRFKRKRSQPSDSNGANVISFQNLTYKANSSSTLVGQRSMQQTPTASVRTLDEDVLLLSNTSERLRSDDSRSRPIVPDSKSPAGGSMEKNESSCGKKGISRSSQFEEGKDSQKQIAVDSDHEYASIDDVNDDAEADALLQKLSAFDQLVDKHPKLSVATSSTSLSASDGSDLDTVESSALLDESPLDIFKTKPN